MASSTNRRFRELGRDAILYGITNSLAKSSSLVLLPLYTRYLSPGELGLLDLALISMAVLNLFMQAELNGAVKRYFYQFEEARRDTLVSTIYAAVLVLASAVALLALLAAGLAARMAWVDPRQATSLNLAVGIAFFGALTSLSSVQLRMERRVAAYSVTQLLNISLAGLLSILFLVRFGWGVPGVLLGQLVGAVVGAAAATYCVRDRLRLVFVPDVLARSLRYSLPLMPAVGLGYVRRFGDRAVILLYLPLASLGVYAFGFKIALIPLLFIQAFQLSWSPLAMSLVGSPDQHDFYSRALRYYTFLLGAAAAAVASAAPEMLLLLGTEAYRGGLPLVGWIVGATVITGASTFVTVGAMVAEKSSVHFSGEAIGAGSTLGLMLLLVPAMGLQGAAISVFAGTLIGSVAMYRLSQRVFRIPYPTVRILLVVAAYALLQGVALPPAGRLDGIASPLARAASWLTFTAFAAALLLDAAERRRIWSSPLRRGGPGGSRLPRPPALSNGGG